VALSYFTKHAASLPAPGAIPQMFFAVLWSSSSSSNAAGDTPEITCCLPSDLDSLPPALRSPDLVGCKIVASVGIDREDVAPNPHWKGQGPSNPYATVGPWLQCFLVLPKHRGTGLGRSLFGYACEVAKKEMQMPWLWLYTDKDGPFAMGKVYAGFGFKRIEEVEIPWLGKMNGKECSGISVMRVDWGWQCDI
jgi:ribosomal protein S18 acetylase RimI-like enzyme